MPRLHLKNSRLLVGFLILWAGVCAHAQSVPDSETLEARTRIENAITARLQTTIATVLDREAFHVSVRVGLSDKPIAKISSAKISPKVTTDSKGEALPADLTMGLLSAQSVVKEYEDELEKMRTRETTVKQTSSDKAYRIDSILVSVGLNEDLGDEYRHTFEEWLKNRVTKDFGKIGAYEVSQIKKAPSVKEAERSKTFFDKLASLQNFLGLLSLGFFALIALLISKFIMSKEAVAQIQVASMTAARKPDDDSEREVAAEPAPRRQLPAADYSALDVGNALAPAPRSSHDGIVEMRGIRDSVAKIAILTDEVGAKMNTVFASWLQTGERGLMKAAAMTDALLSIQQSRQESRQGASSYARTTAATPSFVVPDELKAAMLEVYQKMASLELGEKRRLLDEVYWDLISLKSVGEKALDRPFGYIGQLKDSKMQTVLEGQSATVRALAVLHMNTDVKKRYIDNLSPEKKVELLQESLKIETVKAHDFETTNETLRYVVKGAAQNAAGEIEIAPLLPGLLDTFSVVEETQMLREVSGRLSDKGYRIKMTWPTLAFLDEWPEDSMSLLVKAATSEEVYALLRTMPSFKDAVLKQCAPRVAQIVQDDLAAQERMKSDEREAHLARLKNKLLRLINDEALKLRDIYDPTKRSANSSPKAA